MTAKTQLIQPGPLQITPTAAHSVRTGAETTRAFASVLDQHTAATIEQTPRDEPGRPDTNEPNSATDQQDASAHHESSADAPASDAPDQELPSEPSAQTTDAEVPVGTTQEDAAVLDEHPATEPDSRPVTDSSDTLDVQPVPVPQETENPEAGETPLPKGDSHPGQIPSSDTGSDTNQLQDHRPPAGDPPPVPDADADAGRPAPQAPVPAQGEQPSGPVAVEQPPVEPSSPDALVALSRQAEQSKFQIQGVARVLTHAASVNVAAVAQQELAGNTNLSPATPIDQNLGSDQLVPGFSSDLRPQPTPPPADATANTPPPPPSIDNGQPIRFAPPGQPGDGGGKESPNPTTQPGATLQPPVAAAVSQSVAVAAMPQAISAVLDSVQKVGSLVPGSPVGVGQAGTPNLAGVTAVSGTGGSTIGGDPSAPRPIATQDTTPGAGIDRKELMAQVRRGLASLMRTGGGKMTIRLRPDHLGELRIRVHTENGVVRVRFETETAGARDAIEQGLNGLKDDLETKGVRVEELRVNHRSEGSGTGGQDQRSADSGAREHRGRHGQPQDADGFPGDNHDQDEHHTPNGAWTELGLDTLA